MHRHLRASAAACLLLIPAAAAGEPPPQNTIALDLDAAAASGTPVPLTRPATGIIAVGLVQTGGELDATVSTSPFTSDNGSVSVDLVDCRNTSSVLTQPYPVKLGANSVSRVCLRVPALPQGSTYSGRLLVSPATGPLYIRTITIAPPPAQQGTLVLDRTAASQTVRRSWFRPGSDAVQMEATVTVREKAGAIPLEGLTVRLEQVTAPETGFDLDKNLHFSLNGKPAADLPQLGPNTDWAARRIPAPGQSTVTVGLHNLQPGDYVVPLRFAATNSAVDDAAQRLQLTIHVRDSVVWAVACLIVALIMSFITTKVLTLQRRRAGLLQDVRNLQPAWFAVLPPIAPVVWVQAVLHKAQRLSRRFWLTSPELIEQSISGVKSVLSILDSARQLREKLQLALDTLVFRRAVLSLDRAVAGLRTGALDDAAQQGIKSRLSAFDDWLNVERFVAVFWRDIAPSLQRLQGEVAPPEVPPVATQAVTDLQDAIGAALATPPTTRADVLKAYEQYARLRILWENRDDIAAFLDPKLSDMANMFELADARTWRKLKNSNLTIRTPLASDPDGLEAYDTLEFAVESDVASLNTSYLFQHKLECQWTFRLQPKASAAEQLPGRRRPEPVVLTPVSLGPRVVQYFPHAGDVTVSVKVVYTTDSKDVPDTKGPTIHSSSDYAIYQILAGSEIYSWLLAAVLAIATGLSTYYFKGASWGTYQDYLTLFLWGVGVDQGKNFLQALQFSSPSATAAPAKGSTPT